MKTLLQLQYIFDVSRTQHQVCPPLRLSRYPLEFPQLLPLNLCDRKEIGTIDFRLILGRIQCRHISNNPHRSWLNSRQPRNEKCVSGLVIYEQQFKYVHQRTRSFIFCFQEIERLVSELTRVAAPQLPPSKQAATTQSAITTGKRIRQQYDTPHVFASTDIAYVTKSDDKQNSLSPKRHFTNYSRDYVEDSRVDPSSINPMRVCDCGVHYRNQN